MHPCLRLLVIAGSPLLVAALVPVVHAGSDADGPPFPPLIELPLGFQPEGVASHGSLIYVGNVRDGAIFVADPRTGSGHILVQPPERRVALGLELDPRTNYLFVAGGSTGHVYVYDADTGESVADYALASAPTGINDVVVTRDAATFTDSARNVLYRLPLGRGGRLPPPDQVRTVPLGGETETIPGAFNANGIEATPDGKELIVVNTTVGKLYRVDPDTGFATTIDLGVSVRNGDGLVLRGRTLYVVENASNRITVFRLSHDFSRGNLVDVISDPRFDFPTTAAVVGHALYVANPRFTTRPTPETRYHVLRVPLPSGCD
jgi:sugar lactone lactonase YvrE